MAYQLNLEITMFLRDETKATLRIQAIVQEIDVKTDNIKNIHTAKYVKDDAGERLRAFLKSNRETIDGT